MEQCCEQFVSQFNWRRRLNDDKNVAVGRFVWEISYVHG
jgi:hypothetical protein